MKAIDRRDFLRTAGMAMAAAAGAGAEQGKIRALHRRLRRAGAIKSNTPLKLSYDHELWVHETLLRASREMS